MNIRYIAEAIGEDGSRQDVADCATREKAQAVLDHFFRGGRVREEDENENKEMKDGN